MGEPLANFRRVVDAVHRICDPAPEGLIEYALICDITVRDTRGQEIAAACGQLAAEG
jgi:adenine C2-methylase RlmN of 23S rRNA A2503 and tRNA A37